VYQATEIKNGDDTMVTLWNPADEAQDFVFTLQFSGGRYHLPIHLEARATEMFNVSEVARNQLPNLVSSGVTEGSAHPLRRSSVPRFVSRVC
jgi:hypothetical protein